VPSEIPVVLSTVLSEINAVPSEAPAVLFEKHTVQEQQPGPHSVPSHEQPVHSKMVDPACQTDISGADLDGMEDSNMCEK